VHAAESLEAVRRFNREEYLAEMAKTQPEVTALVRNDPEASKLQPLAMQAEEEKPTEKPRPRLRLWMFQASAFGTAQASKGGNSPKISGLLGSAELSLNPTLRLLGPIHLRGHLGLSPFKSQDGEVFFASRFGILLSFVLFDHVLVEGGAGGEQWFGKGELRNTVMLNLGYKFGYEGFIERIFLGVSHYDYTSNSRIVHLRAGLGFQF